jgi:pyridoxamine 5'-phosphate oxidase
MAIRQVNPFQHFSLWFRAAVKRSPGTWFDPTAMTLATSSKSGDVTARMVLLKKFGPEGFTFYTNYASRKGRQLSENPRAALVFHWPHLRRQVRIEGSVEQISREEAEEYFHSRPQLYQLAAAVSKQSEIIPSRKFLVDRFRHLQKRLAGEAVPLPKTWGGYRLAPGSIEFWQHRENRLHDRLRYRKAKGGTWTLEHLAP